MTKDVDNYIRAFGMSGMLLHDELQAIEKKFGLELGHTYDECCLAEKDRLRPASAVPAATPENGLPRKQNLTTFLAKHGDG